MTYGVRADSEQFSDQVLGSMPNALIVCAVGGEIVVWNAAAEQLLGWRTPDVLGRQLADLRLEQLEAVIDEIQIRPEPLERELLVRCEGGHFVAVSLHASCTRGRSWGEVTVLVLSDLTERIRSEQALRASQHQLEVLLHYSADMVALVDSSGIITFVNDAITERAYFGIHEMIGRCAIDFVHPDDEARTRAELGAVLAGEESNAALVFRMRTKSGEHIWMEGRAVNLLAHPSVDGVLVTLHDVTERVALEAQLVHQATHDALTGLPNRSLFVDRLDHHVEHARRHGLLVAVLFWDVDRFKLVNDRGGHAVGDELLVEVAHRAAQALRAEDSLARMGGDEFVACAEVQDETQACALAERLLEALNINLTLGRNQRYMITSSIGVAFGAGPSAERLLAEADRAMYDAKRRGRASITVFSVADGAGVHCAADRRSLLS